MSEKAAYPQAYLDGIVLFNDGHFWHAHEAWEEAWKAESVPTTRTFYKGIIQTTAALVHWQRGNIRGLHRNWAKARPKLQSLPPRVLGLDIPALITTMDQFEAAAGVDVTPPHIALQ